MRIKFCILKHFKNTEIEIIKGNLTDLDVDVIVNPANSHGLMGGGVAHAIKNKGGGEIERDAIFKAPFHIGEAVTTTAGKLKSKYVIHAPTMEEPTQPTNSESIKRAVKAALEEASSLNVHSIAFPGMGTGVGKVPKKKAAMVMVGVIKNFQADYLKFEKIFLVTYSNQMYEAWREAAQKIFK